MEKQGCGTEARRRGGGKTSAWGRRSSVVVNFPPDRHSQKERQIAGQSKTVAGTRGAYRSGVLDVRRDDVRRSGVVDVRCDSIVRGNRLLAALGPNAKRIAGPVDRSLRHERRREWHMHALSDRYCPLVVVGGYFCLTLKYPQAWGIGIDSVDTLLG